MKLDSAVWKAFSRKDDDERDQSIMHAISGGRTCDEIGGTERQQRFCRAIEAETRQLASRGLIVVPDNSEGQES